MNGGRRAPRLIAIGATIGALVALQGPIAPAGGDPAPADQATGDPPPAARAAGRGGEERRLRSSLAGAMRSAGAYSGAYVRNVNEGRTLFTQQADRNRILASNVKLFTTAAALRSFGARTRLSTSVMSAGWLDRSGRWHGTLYLRGGGDPTFGSAAFARRSYLSNSSVEALAADLKRRGLRRVTGRVVGDESRFDSRRGGPASGYRTSIYVGPLSALSFNRGLADERGSSFQSNPPLYAAARLHQALTRRGIRVGRSPGVGRTPRNARQLAAVSSPTMARLVQITNKRSDNLFAELLAKGLGARELGRGTTAAGTRRAEAYARKLGTRAHLVDGSGLSRANYTSPRRVGRLLLRLRQRSDFGPFYDSLSIAGRDGTLAYRMRGGPARGRCRAKTGTLSNVSALSGYCRSLGGDTLVFSILMNAVNPSGARSLQDRMAQAMAAYRG